MTSVSVNLKNHSYEIYIKSCLFADDLSSYDLFKTAKKIVIIADENVSNHYGEELKQSLSGKEILMFTFAVSEELKTIDTVSKFYDFAIEHRLERNTLVLALGGGITGDLVGFFAATYLRGVPFIQIPTSLLAMVDSSVGGKVAYNHPKGKNLIGAFYQPKGVLIDPAVLKTLPKDEFACGMAECIKHGLLADVDLFEWMETNINEINSHSPKTLEELIARNVSIKAKIVSEDEKEQGIRALLNLGHTFGHAIEVTSGYGNIKHGQAVALGCVAAAHLSMQLGHISNEDLERTIALFEKANLPVSTNLKPVEELLEAMSLDKKVQDGNIRLILLKSLGEAYIDDTVTPELIKNSFDYIRA